MVQVLSTEDPSEFRTKSARVLNKNGNAEIYTVGSEINFQEMMTERKKLTDSSNIRDSLQKDGYIFANVGISGVFTMTIGNGDYLLLVKQDRKGHGDFTDSVTKLVSGYIKSQDLEQPISALEKELSEEVLPIAKDGRLMRFEMNGKVIGKPFAKHYEDHPNTIAMQGVPKYNLSGLDSMVAVNGHNTSGIPKILYHAPTNSAQVIHSYHLDQKGVNFEKLGVSLVHAEDKFNPEKKIVETIVNPEGIALVKIEKGKLTDRVYTLTDGKLRNINPESVVLSEAFAPKENGIVTANNIKLTDYLKNNAPRGVFAAKKLSFINTNLADHLIKDLLDWNEELHYRLSMNNSAI